MESGLAVKEDEDVMGDSDESLCEVMVGSIHPDPLCVLVSKGSKLRRSLLVSVILCCSFTEVLSGSVSGSI